MGLEIINALVNEYWVLRTKQVSLGGKIPLQPTWKIIQTHTKPQTMLEHKLTVETVCIIWTGGQCKGKALFSWGYVCKAKCSVWSERQWEDIRSGPWQNTMLVAVYKMDSRQEKQYKLILTWTKNI